MHNTDHCYCNDYLQSLKSREVPLPPEDNEIFSLSSLGLGDDQQQMTLPEGYPNPYLEQYSDHGVAERSNSLSVEERKEILIVARNNVERLSSILKSDASQKPATVIFFILHNTSSIGCHTFGSTCFHMLAKRNLYVVGFEIFLILGWYIMSNHKRICIEPSEYYLFRLIISVTFLWNSFCL